VDGPREGVTSSTTVEALDERENPVSSEQVASAQQEVARFPTPPSESDSGGSVIRAPDGHETYRVNVVDDRTVQVTGLTPQQVVERLATGHGGDHVTVVSEDPVEVAVDVPELSNREVQIVRLITQGRSNQELARELYLSVNTVKSYIRSAYRKMKVESRSQAVMWGVERGLASAEQTRPRSAS
jgi:DNA-binding CsgD family transcriptional regulator